MLEGGGKEKKGLKLFKVSRSFMERAISWIMR
jgi:hypothetical protein